MFGLDVVNLVIIFAAAISLLLAVFIFFRDRTNLANIWFAVFALSLFVWSIAMIFYRQASTIEQTLFWVRALYIAPLFIPSSLAVFSAYFPKGKKFINQWLLYLLFIPTLFMLVSVLTPDAVITGVEIVPNVEKIIHWGPYYFIYNIYFILYFLAVYIILFKKYFSSTGIDKIQVKYIILSIFLPSIFANTTNLLLPTFGIFRFNWVGQILILAVAVFIVYAILKHHLLNIKVIATEIFSVSISLILLIDAVLSKDWPEFLVKFGLFVGISIFSIFLIRGVLNEIRARERITKLVLDLKKVNAELKRLDKAKSEFISIASHQLRTPLSVIKGYLSMMLEGAYGALPGGVEDKIRKSLESNERLIKLVDHLLNLSHMEKGKMEFEPKRISLTEIVESVIDELKPEAKDKGLKFIYRPSEQNGLFVSADEQKLRQVIVNLVDNAIKYTTKGRVEVILKEQGNYAFCSVEDTGVGISSEEKNDIFKKFVRGKRVSRMWTEGAGLGLYVARLIIEEHRGKIGLESEGEEKGSKFWFKLPLAE